MTTITITITVEAGPSDRVNIAQNGHAVQVAPFEDELIPLPDGVIPLPGDVQPVQAFRGAATGVAVAGLCPVHRVPWKTVPSGISKKTGRAYEAFLACPERGCDQRPA